MWTVIGILSSIVGYFFISWTTDRKLIADLRARVTELEREIRAFNNGSSVAVVVAKVNDLHQWMMAHVKDVK